MGADIEKLSGDLLAEILHRLPYKDSRRCLSVCKSWSLLLSQPSFLKKLMTFHRRRPNNQQQPYYVVVNLNKPPLHNNESGGKNCVRQDNNDSKALVLDRSLDFLPKREWKELQVLRVSGDLFLCSHVKKSHRPKRFHSGSAVDHYYVCNALTRQWVALPPRPHDCAKHFQFHSSRFYNEDPDSDGIHNPEYEYIVLVMNDRPEWMEFETFSSKDKVWKTLSMPIPLDFSFHGGWKNWGLWKSVLWEGILWCSNKRCIIRFNIKDPRDEPRSIDLPRETFHPNSARYIGVCNGRLRLAGSPYLFLYDAEQMIKVWELDEEVVGGWKWRLVHEIPIWDNLCFEEESNSNSYNNVVGTQMLIIIGNIWFHPNDPDIVFIERKECVAEWNARTKDFKHYPEAVPSSGRMFLTPPRYPTSVLPLNDIYE